MLAIASWLILTFNWALQAPVDHVNHEPAVFPGIALDAAEWRIARPTDDPHAGFDVALLLDRDGRSDRIDHAYRLRPAQGLLRPRHMAPSGYPWLGASSRSIRFRSWRF